MFMDIGDLVEKFMTDFGLSKGLKSVGAPECEAGLLGLMLGASSVKGLRSGISATSTSCSGVTGLGLLLLLGLLGLLTGSSR